MFNKLRKSEDSQWIRLSINLICYARVCDSHSITYGVMDEERVQNSIFFLIILHSQNFLNMWGKPPTKSERLRQVLRF